MLVTARVKVTGVKRGKGEYEGRAFDYTRVFVEVQLDDSQGNAAGFCSAQYNFGKSGNFDALSRLAFPCDCEVDFVEVGTGAGEVRRVVQAIRPVVTHSQAAVAAARAAVAGAPAKA